MTTALPSPECKKTASQEGVRPVPMMLHAVFCLSLCHLFNDAIQSLLSAVYPLVKEELGLTFKQIGLIGLVFQFTASVFQPLIGAVFDRHPKRWPLPASALGLAAGLIVLATASSYIGLLFAAFLIGTGSAVFHPEAARGTRLMAQGKYGLAQSLFQTGGNIGSACGPLLAAIVVVPFGQRAAFLLLSITLIGFFLLCRLSGKLFEVQMSRRQAAQKTKHLAPPRKGTWVILCILVILICTKNVYTTSMQNFYSFHLIERFGFEIAEAQYGLFAFMAAVAVGTLVGGLLTDKIGTRRIINFSILGALPFAIVLPHLGVVMTIITSICIGLILASAFSAIIVYGQELMPDRIGLISGLFFGLAFGFSGIGSGLLGVLADHLGLQKVMVLCAFLPTAGVLSLFLPDLRGRGCTNGSDA